MQKDTSYYLSPEGRQELFKKFQEQVNEANIACSAKFVKVAENKVDTLFEEAINRFYNDYRPGNTVYQRTKSLYNVHNVEGIIGSNGATLSGGFDPLKMTGFRDGKHEEGGLYSQVFLKGWHGGAGSGDFTRVKRNGKTVQIHTPHPNKGTPYWRDAKSKFTYWCSKPAPIADPSPYDDFMINLKEYWEGQEGQDDYYKCWEDVSPQYLRSMKLQ